MTPETSIIIRTKNEERWIEEVLKKLFRQTYKDFEIIIVDSGSGDRTLEITRKFPAKIFGIPPEKFSYPHALNFGVERSSATKYIVVLSAHSLPISDTWLADGLENFNKYEKVAGVFAYPIALPDGTFWDKFFQNVRIRFKILLPLLRIFFQRFRTVFTKPIMGVLGFTNAIIRKDLWEQRRFNEAYGAGGEDGEWAAYWFRRGYIVIREKKFTVMHSHYLGLRGWIRQFLYWRSLRHPRPFKQLTFR